MHSRSALLLWVLLLGLLCDISLLAAAPKRALMQEDVGMVNPLQYGSALNATTLSAAVTAIGSDSRILFLSTGSWAISANVTIPTNITLWIPRGSSVAFSASATLTVNGGLVADYDGWYSGDGTLVVANKFFPGDFATSFVVSGCLPSVPASSLTFGAFACTAQIINAASTTKNIVQSSSTVGPLSSGDGTYWLAIHRDTSSTVTGWTRHGSTHYLWQKNASQPSAPTDGTLLARATVASSVISAVTDFRIPASYSRFRRFDITDPLYGAVAGSDSTTAIQAAINGANGRGPVYIPQGSFTVTTGFTGIAANQEIFGEGYASHLSVSISGGITFDVDAVRCHFHDFRMSGTMGTGIRLQDDADFCIVERMDISGATAGTDLCDRIGVCMNGPSDITIRDNNFSGNGDGAGEGGDIIQFTGGNRYQIIGNRCLSTTGAYGVQLASTFDSIVADNVINAKITNVDHGGYGITIYNDPAGSGGRNVVTGNRINNTQGTGIYILRGPYTVVSNNVLETVATTQAGGSLGIGGIVMEGDSTTEAENCIVTGNTVRNSGQAGIRFVGVYCNVSNNVIDTTGTNVARPGIWMTKAANGSVIANNSITLSGTSGIDVTASVQDLIITGNVVDTTAVSASANGIIVNTCTDCIVSHNRVQSAGARGIYTLGTRFIIAHNIVVDSGTTTANTYEGIRNEATYATIIGNHSYNTGATGQNYGVRTTAAYVTIQDNQVINNQTAGLLISGTATIRRGNRVSIGEQQGIATLNGTTGVTVSTVEVLAASRIVLTRATSAGSAANNGHIYPQNISAGTSFDILSTNASDDGTVYWELVH